jgi:hypothetical protein
MKIHLVGTEIFHADGRTERLDKVIGVFCNSAKAPNKIDWKPRRTVTMHLLIRS